MIDHNEEKFEYDGPSKSQLKREMHALQGMGKQMLELSQEQLDSLKISDSLRRAIDESARIRQNEAKRRHLQYIGKIIRQEPDPEALQAAITAFSAGSDEHTRRHHLAERWRDRIITEGDSIVAEFLSHCPGADVQHLRNLARNSRKEAQKPQSAGHSRKLFRYLRECIDANEQM